MENEIYKIKKLNINKVNNIKYFKLIFSKLNIKSI